MSTIITKRQFPGYHKYELDQKNQVSKQIGALMAQGKKEEAEAVKAEVEQISKRLTELEPLEKEYQDKVIIY